MGLPEVPHTNDSLKFESFAPPSGFTKNLIEPNRVESFDFISPRFVLPESYPESKNRFGESDESLPESAFDLDFGVESEEVAEALSAFGDINYEDDNLSGFFLDDGTVLESDQEVESQYLEDTQLEPSGEPIEAQIRTARLKRGPIINTLDVPLEAADIEVVSTTPRDQQETNPVFDEIINSALGSGVESRLQGAQKLLDSIVEEQQRLNETNSVGTDDISLTRSELEVSEIAHNQLESIRMRVNQLNLLENREISIVKEIMEIIGNIESDKSDIPELFVASSSSSAIPDNTVGAVSF